MPPTRMARSSAKAWGKSLWIDGLAWSLLMLIFHKRGDNTPPCGQPRLTRLVMVTPLRVREIVLLETMKQIQFATVGEILDWASLVRMDSKEMLSNAPSMSRKVLSLGFLLRECSIREVSHWGAESVEKFLLKPCCNYQL